jgi:hypothetical protein
MLLLTYSVIYSQNRPLNTRYSKSKHSVWVGGVNLNQHKLYVFDTNCSCLIIYSAHTPVNKYIWKKEVCEILLSNLLELSETSGSTAQD